MFKFDEYTVRFKHVTSAGIDPFANPEVSHSVIKRWVKEGSILPYKAKTICTIFKNGQETPVCSGVALLSWFDKFDQQFALEKSFGRAIAQLYPTNGGYSRGNAKRLRCMAWVQFAKHHKRPMGNLTEVAKALGAS